jgi:hypothetical protein
MKIKFGMKVRYAPRPKITFIFPANRSGYYLGGGEFMIENTTYPPRLYKVHDWNLKFN